MSLTWFHRAYHVYKSSTHCSINKAVVDIRLRPRCTIPSSRPIIHSSNACNQASASVVCTPLHGLVQFATHGVLGLSSTCFFQNCPFPIGIVTPTSHFFGQAHPSSQTASRSVQPFYVGLRYHTVQCIVNGEENPQNCPTPLGFCHPA